MENNNANIQALRQWLVATGPMQAILANRSDDAVSKNEDNNAAVEDAEVDLDPDDPALRALLAKGQVLAARITAAHEAWDKLYVQRRNVQRFVQRFVEPQRVSSVTEAGVPSSTLGGSSRSSRSSSASGVSSIVAGVADDVAAASFAPAVNAKPNAAAIKELCQLQARQHQDAASSSSSSSLSSSSSSSPPLVILPAEQKRDHHRPVLDTAPRASTTSTAPLRSILKMPSQPPQPAQPAPNVSTASRAEAEAEQRGQLERDALERARHTPYVCIDCLRAYLRKLQRGGYPLGVVPLRINKHFEQQQQYWRQHALKFAQHAANYPGHAVNEPGQLGQPARPAKRKHGSEHGSAPEVPPAARVRMGSSPPTPFVVTDQCVQPVVAGVVTNPRQRSGRTAVLHVRPTTPPLVPGEHPFGPPVDARPATPPLFPGDLPVPTAVPTTGWGQASHHASHHRAGGLGQVTGRRMW